MLPPHFRYFHCFNFKVTFDKNFLKKYYHFLTPIKFLLCRKILRSGNRWQLNYYRKYPLNNSQNVQKKFVCLVCVSIFSLFQH